MPLASFPSTLNMTELKKGFFPRLFNTPDNLQLLYYQEQQIPKQGASADRIRHVHNGGEQSVRTVVTSYFVDGYDALTRTVYEFRA